jgi:hypothetical protein
MKSALSFCLFLLTINSFSQSITATATRQDWVGGICCQTRTDYTIAVTGNLDSLNKSDIKYAMIDGLLFSINKIADEKNDLKIFHFNFKLAVDNSREKISNEKIEIVDRSIVQENYVMISYNNQEMKIPIEKIEQLFSHAYP